MYGYRQSAENALMTNLNSISSSLSSIDTVGRRPNTKASVDNLINQRSHSIASTSLLWRGGKSDRHSTTTSIRNGSRYAGSDIYYSHGRRSISGACLNLDTALICMLAPLLLLTITRQIVDFLGQIWLQIIINFFTIIIIIVALFGIKQRRMNYLVLYSLWALMSTVWNVILICIHTKLRDVGINEDALSFYTGATSWWHANGPGCLPYNISSFQTPVSIFQPNIITGCRVDYHIIESFQAGLYAFISLLTSLTCCCIISSIRSQAKIKNQPAKAYRLNTLTNDRSRINPDPYPSHTSSRFGPNSASLKRTATKASSRSSQHSVSSMRSTRRRRQSIDGATIPTPRGSTSSAQRSQKYGSISSRRSGSKRDRRGEISSLTYGTTGDRTTRQARLSSMSSAEYLPSYQPPHSSSANLLSSYGEISSIDSYNNNSNSIKRQTKNHQTALKAISRGNTNPTYSGSRSSVCDQNYGSNNVNNYDDLSHIYSNSSNKDVENPQFSQSNSIDSQRQRSTTYQQNNMNILQEKNGFRARGQSEVAPHKIQAETYRRDPMVDYSTSGSFKSVPMQNGTGKQIKQEENQLEINHNYINSRLHPIYTNQNGSSVT